MAQSASNSTKTGTSAGGQVREREGGSAPAVTRAIAILRLLARSRNPLGVNSIAKTLGLVPSTCLHILRALVAEAFVRMDPATKTYSLDAGILPLAYRISRQDDFTQRSAPLLASIASRFGITAVGTRVAGLNQMVVLAVSQPDAIFRLHIDVGSHFPGLVSATGRCNAAFGDYAISDLKRAFARLDWDTPPTFDDWLLEVEKTRKAGFSVDTGNYIHGVTIVAVPVFDRNHDMSHAVVGVGLSQRLTTGKVREVGKALKTIAAELSLNAPDDAEEE
jgi:DNA-binding IclR family transcriptional regulator